MSVCIKGTCPHERGVFIWVADGVWLDDKADPNYGGYPWVHDTSAPGAHGHLEVCDLKPFATPEEAGEVCACGHHEHGGAGGPIPSGMISNPRPCLSCECADFSHRPEDLARWRAAGMLSANRFRFGETTPQPLNDHELLARLSEGEAVPGHPAACKREGCAHLALWHGQNGKFKGQPCGKCECPGFTREAGQVMPEVQGSLFDGAFA
jgi:hypothetical protein